MGGISLMAGQLQSDYAEASLTALHEAQFLSLIDGIYEAALDPEHWAVVLETLGRQLKSHVGAIFVQDANSNAVGFLQSFGQEPTAQTAYRDHYSTVNLWLEKARELQEGELIHTPEMVDDTALQKSEFYADWLRPQNIHYALGCTLRRDFAFETNVTVLRSRNAGPYSPDEQLLFRQLTTHIQRAIEIHRRVHISNLVQTALCTRLERVSIAAAIVDRQCRLVFANSAAETLFFHGDGLTVRRGCLVATNPDDHSALLARISEALAPALERGEATSDILRVRRHYRRPVFVLVSPLSKSERIGIGIGGALALLLIHAGQREVLPRDRDLRVLYGLTPAEAKLMQALLSGQTLADYSKAVGISINTSKACLKQVFTKTGASKQSDLFRRVLMNPLLQINHE